MTSQTSSSMEDVTETVCIGVTRTHSLLQPTPTSTLAGKTTLGWPQTPTGLDLGLRPRHAAGTEQMFAANSSAIMFFLFIHFSMITIGVGFLVFGLVRRNFRRAILAGCSTLVSCATWQVLWGSDRFASVVYSSDTVYSAQFSLAAFEELKVGGREDLVLKSLGQPLEKRLYEGDGEYWFYSKHGKRSENYWNNFLIFDRVTRRILCKRREFYID